MAYLSTPDENETHVKRRGIFMAPEGVEDYKPRARVGTGNGTISGTATVGGAAPALSFAVLLNEANALPIGYTAIAGDGTYEFTDVGDGIYCVVVIDGTGTMRGKVIHTVIE